MCPALPAKCVTYLAQSYRHNAECRAYFAAYPATLVTVFLKTETLTGPVAGKTDYIEILAEMLAKGAANIAGGAANLADRAVMLVNTAANIAKRVLS